MLNRQTPRQPDSPVCISSSSDRDHANGINGVHEGSGQTMTKSPYDQRYIRRGEDTSPTGSPGANSLSFQRVSHTAQLYDGSRNRSRMVARNDTQAHLHGTNSRIASGRTATANAKIHTPVVAGMSRIHRFRRSADAHENSSSDSSLSSSRRAHKVKNANHTTRADGMTRGFAVPIASSVQHEANGAAWSARNTRQTHHTRALTAQPHALPSLCGDEDARLSRRGPTDVAQATSTTVGAVAAARVQERGAKVNRDRLLGVRSELEENAGRMGSILRPTAPNRGHTDFAHTGLSALSTSSAMAKNWSNKYGYEDQKENALFSSSTDHQYSTDEGDTEDDDNEPCIDIITGEASQAVKPNIPLSHSNSHSNNNSSDNSIYHNGYNVDAIKAQHPGHLVDQLFTNSHAHGALPPPPMSCVTDSLLSDDVSDATRESDIRSRPLGKTCAGLPEHAEANGVWSPHPMDDSFDTDDGKSSYSSRQCKKHQEEGAAAGAGVGEDSEMCARACAPIPEQYNSVERARDPCGASLRTGSDAATVTQETVKSGQRRCALLPARVRRAVLSVNAKSNTVDRSQTSHTNDTSRIGNNTSKSKSKNTSAGAVYTRSNDRVDAIHTEGADDDSVQHQCTHDIMRTTNGGGNVSGATKAKCDDSDARDEACVERVVALGHGGAASVKPSLGVDSCLPTASSPSRHGVTTVRTAAVAEEKPTAPASSVSTSKACVTRGKRSAETVQQHESVVARYADERHAAAPTGDVANQQTEPINVEQSQQTDPTRMDAHNEPIDSHGQTEPTWDDFVRQQIAAPEEFAAVTPHTAADTHPEARSRSSSVPFQTTSLGTSAEPHSHGTPTPSRLCSQASTPENESTSSTASTHANTIVQPVKGAIARKVSAAGTKRVSIDIEAIRNSMRSHARRSKNSSPSSKKRKHVQRPGFWTRFAVLCCCCCCSSSSSRTKNSRLSQKAAAALSAASSASARKSSVDVSKTTSPREPSDTQSVQTDCEPVQETENTQQHDDLVFVMQLKQSESLMDTATAEAKPLLANGSDKGVIDSAGASLDMVAHDASDVPDGGNHTEREGGRVYASSHGHASKDVHDDELQDDNINASNNGNDDDARQILADNRVDTFVDDSAACVGEGKQTSRPHQHRRRRHTSHGVNKQDDMPNEKPSHRHQRERPERHRRHRHDRSRSRTHRHSKSHVEGTAVETMPSP